jgi:hypothetical protein
LTTKLSTKIGYARGLLKIVFSIILIGVISYFVYNNYFASSIYEIITIYPDNTETKIKPLRTSEASLYSPDNLTDFIKSKQHNYNKKIDLLPEPEQPLNIDFLFSRKQEEYLDPIDIIITDIVTGNKEPSPITTKSSTINSSLNITKVTEKTKELDKTLIQNTVKHKYKIQLASVKSEVEGIALWEKLKKRYPKLLGTDKMTMQKIKDNQGKFYYILLVNGYNNLNQAKNICKQLAKPQQRCTVLTN